MVEQKRLFFRGPYSCFRGRLGRGRDLVARVRLSEKGDQRAEWQMGQERGFEGPIDTDLVGVLPAGADAHNVTRRDQVGYDPLHGPLSDANLLSDFAHREFGTAGDGQEDVAMVG